MMDDKHRVCSVMEESEVDVQIRQTEAQPQSRWSNGQCVLAMPSCSLFNPSFDLPLCCATLERCGFQIPAAELETLLKTALDVPSVKRYLVFNSALFHFTTAPLLYLVVWCAVFSTLRLYITAGDYWVLCLCVSLIAIFITTAIIFVLNLSNNKINMNLDVRLIRVNEYMVKHKLLVAVADWVQNCNGNMQLYFVYWDIACCLRSLTETLEDVNVANDAQIKLKRKMSNLVLVTEVSDIERGPEEQRPLLGNEDTYCTSSSSQQGDAKVAANYSLIPDASLSAQAKAYQLLMTYSAVYVKLLVSERLSGPSHHRLRSRRNHCTTAPFCLCQYIKTKLLC